MGQPVVHFEIISNESKKLHAFYGELFGWKIDSNNPMGYGMVDTGAKSGIPGGIGAAPTGAQPFLTVYVQVPDLQAALKRAESLGGKTVMPPTDIPGAVSFAQFTDPAGNLVGLVRG